MTKIKWTNFLNMVTYILITTNCVSMATIQSDDSAVYNMIYHEVKPYIFENELGIMTGFISDIYRLFESLCLAPTGKSKLVKYAKKVSSQKQLLDIYYNESIRYGEGELENLTAGTALWGPIITSDKVNKNASRQIFQSVITVTDHMAVIIKRSKIDLVFKMVFAFKNGFGLFFVICLLLIISGLVFWLLERADNPLILRLSFAQSLFNSIWWSFITMATVGYGDFVPHTRLGRIWSVLWMYLALVAICIMTANITSVVYGIEDYALDRKSVSVMKNSYEGITAVHTYHTENIEYETLKEALEAVENDDVFAALINEQIVAWNVDMLSNIGDELLVVIYTLSVRINISVLKAKGGSSGKVWACTQQFYGLLDNIRLTYNKKIKIDVVHFNALESIFNLHNSPIFFILCTLVCLFFMSGVVYDVVKKNITINGFRISISGRSSEDDACSRVRHALQKQCYDISNEIKVTNFVT